MCRLNSCRYFLLTCCNERLLAGNYSEVCFAGIANSKFTVSREWPARVLCNFKTQKAWSPTAYAPSTRTATPTTTSKTGGDFTALLHTIFLERKSMQELYHRTPFYTCTACADFEGWCLSRRTLPNQSRQSFCLKFAGIY